MRRSTRKRVRGARSRLAEPRADNLRGAGSSLGPTRATVGTEDRSGPARPGAAHAITFCFNQTHDERPGTPNSGAFSGELLG